MKILILCIADGEYLKGAKIVQDSFRANIANPEGHELTFRVDEPNHDFDYLAFMNEGHKGCKISLGRLKYFDESEFDRIIYIDSDMEVVGNVDLLLSSELNKGDFWACHVHGYENYYRERMKLRDITSDRIINGGLQIINKPLLNGFIQKLIRSVIKVGESFDGSDQGYLSEFLPRVLTRMGWLNDKYNYCLQDPYRPNISDVRINHYTGTKLWQV